MIKRIRNHLNSLGKPEMNRRANLPISEFDGLKSREAFVSLILSVVKADLCSSVSNCKVVSVEKMAKNDLRY